MGYLKQFRHGLIIIQALLSAMALVAEARAQDTPEAEVVATIPHSSGVLSVALSRDGSQCVSGGRDGTVKIWDARSGRLIRTIQASGEWVYAVAFSNDATQVLAGDGDTLRMWEAASGRLIHSFQRNPAIVLVVAFSHDDRLVLSGGHGLKLWDSKSGRLVQEFNGGSVWSAAISTKGDRVVSGDFQGRLKIWDATMGRLILTIPGHSGCVNSVSFSRDGDRILSSSHDTTLKLWDTSTGRLIQEFKGHSSYVTSVGFLVGDDGRIVAGSADGTVRLWDSRTGRLTQTFGGHGSITSLALDDHGGILFGTVDGALKLLDADKGLVRAIQWPSHRVLSVAYSPDGTKVLSGGDDKTLRLWDAETGRLLCVFEGHTDAVRSVAFSPDGTRVLSGGDDGTLRLWQVQLRNDVTTIDKRQPIRAFKSGLERINSVAFSADGILLSAGSPKEELEPALVQLWNADTGELIRTIQGAYEIRIKSITFSPDGTRILSGGFDSSNKPTAKLWDTSTGQLIRAFDEDSLVIGSVSVAFRGDRILSASDDHVTLWDASTGRLVRTFPNSGSVYSVAFSPTGDRVLGAYTLTINLWNAETGQLLHAFNGHSDRVRSVAFSNNGRRIVSGSADGSVRLWSATTGELLATLFGGDDNEWLAITPKGFFAGSGGAPDMLSVVRGLRTYSVMQFYEHLYQPDLVTELLKDDPDEKYHKAARELNLEKILNSGPAPVPELLEQRTESLGPGVRVRVRIKDEGGGIGRRVVWRVNGSARGETQAPQLQIGGENAVVVEQLLKVVPGQVHTVEVVAYNKDELLASVPLRFPVSIEGAASTETRMHVLAIGITDYEKMDWYLPLAAGDASAFRDVMKEAGKGLFTDVKDTLVQDKGATARGIEAAFARIANAPDLKASDVFVLYIAGHGRYDGARYYFIPQDLNTDLPPKGKGHRIRDDAINQDTLQRWIASVQVDKRLVILDTCESATGAATIIRALAGPRMTAMEQLQHATGDNLIAAAGQAAFESNKLGHGLLTYAILEAFAKREGADSDETVTTDTLASHASERVPILSREIFGQEQLPTRKLSAGRPIPLGYRRATVGPNISQPLHRNFILMRDELVHTDPNAGAVSDPPIRLVAPMIVNILAFDEQAKWVRIQWGSGAGGTGLGVGWVPADSVKEPNVAPK